MLWPAPAAVVQWWRYAGSTVSGDVGGGALGEVRPQGRATAASPFDLRADEARLALLLRDVVASLDASPWGWKRLPARIGNEVEALIATYEQVARDGALSSHHTERARALLDDARRVQILVVAAQRALVVTEQVSDVARRRMSAPALEAFRGELASLKGLLREVEESAARGSPNPWPDGIPALYVRELPPGLVGAQAARRLLTQAIQAGDQALKASDGEFGVG